MARKSLPRRGPNQPVEDLESLPDSCIARIGDVYMCLDVVSREWKVLWYRGKQFPWAYLSGLG